MSTPLRRYYRGTTLYAIQDVQAGTTSYPHLDHQGTVQCLTSSAGAVTDRFASDAWGVQVKRTGSSINRQWYVGNWGYYRQKDWQSDYVRARWFVNPRGRWNGVDPVTRLGASKYGYSDNTPASTFDASGLITCAQLKALMAQIEARPGTGSPKRCKAIFYFYAAVAEYLGEQGCTKTKQYFQHWLNGSGTTIVESPGVFTSDPIVAQYVRAIRECLTSRVGVSPCKPCDTHTWTTSVWPARTCLIGAVGYLTVDARLSCCAGAHAINCTLKWSFTKQWDWDFGKSIPCLPRCDLEVPDDLAAELDECSRRRKGRVTHTKPFQLESSMVESFPLLYGHYSTLPAPCPKANPVRPPTDWPGPWGLNCLWTASRREEK